MKIGVMFGNPETTTGGNALKFYASVRLDIRRIGAIKQAEKVIGNRTKVKVVKNKLAPPFREVEFDIMYGEGISKEGDILDLGSGDINVVEKSGAWFAWKGERIGQGRENAKEFLKTNPEVATQIELAVLEKHGIRRVADEREKAPRPTGEAGEGGAAAAANGSSAPAKKSKAASDIPRA
jgi:recombination protein RecA